MCVCAGGAIRQQTDRQADRVCESKRATQFSLQSLQSVNFGGGHRRLVTTEKTSTPKNSLVSKSENINIKVSALTLVDR